MSKFNRDKKGYRKNFRFQPKNSLGGIMERISYSAGYVVGQIERVQNDRKRIKEEEKRRKEEDERKRREAEKKMRETAKAFMFCFKAAGIIVLILLLLSGVANGQTARHFLVDRSDEHLHPLANGLQRFEARASLGGVQPHAAGREMVDGHEDGD